MSLQSELGMTENELQHASQPIRDKILAGVAKTRALDLLTGTQIFRRSNRRLDATARAVRKQQGLDMPDDPDDEIVLGDKQTHYHTVEKSGALGKLAIAAALATGLGLTGVAGVALWKAPEIIAAFMQPKDSDTDTLTDVTPGFGVPEDVE